MRPVAVGPGGAGDHGRRIYLLRPTGQLSYVEVQLDLVDTALESWTLAGLSLPPERPLSEPLLRLALRYGRAEPVLGVAVSSRFALVAFGPAELMDAAAAGTIAGCGS